MKEQRLFLVGSGPLPCESGILTQTAFGLRTWQFLSALKDFPGKIRLVLLIDRAHYPASQEFFSPTSLTLFGKDVEVFYVEKISGIFQKMVEKLFHNFSPTICAGVNLEGAYALCELRPKIPFWADLNGWSGGEAQSQAYVYGHDGYIPEIWKKEQAVLSSADKISVVSVPQKYITIGQLATLGRINHKTEYHRFVSVVPNGNETLEVAGSRIKSGTTRKNSKSMDFELPLSIPEKSFLIFFSGAYNTWLDEKSLFEGLELAMKKNPEIYFVSTGSGIKGFSNKIFDQFLSRIERSKYKDRFVFLGWLPKEDLVDCYAQIDVAINLDRKNLESEVGARNRINEWVAYDVPVMSTVESEISQEFFSAGGLLPIKTENSQDLAKQIAVAQKMDLRAMAKKAKAFAKKTYSYEALMRDFAAFLKNPEISPDRNYRVNMKGNLFQKVLFRIKTDGFVGLVRLVLRKIGMKK